MRQNYLSIVMVLMAGMFSIAALAQTNTITGTVRDPKTNTPIPGATVLLKGTGQGTTTDDKGAFQLTSTQKPPFTIIVSAVSFGTKEVVVTNASTPVSVELSSSYTLAGDVTVTGASRTIERSLESSVSVEPISRAAIVNAPSPSYYDLIGTRKGVDITTSSFTFKTPSTRGFNGSGNLRFNQLVDGMDNQAPALNFAVGSIIGLTELDVESMELLPGASSALYGSGGMNGTLLINSKSPFTRQGLSFQIKQGVNHVDNYQREPAPFYDWSVRWAKKVTDKFAFKIGAQFVQAQDWQGTDERNLLRNNVISSLKEGDRQTDPNYDGVNIFGDEASASMAYVAQGGIFGPSNPTLNGVIGTLIGQLGRAPTQNEIVGYYAANPQFGPINVLATGLAKGFFGNQLVSRTGYAERDLVDYNAYNFRLSAGLNYKITDAIEASFLGYFGTGTSVYTGADRYALKNLKMGQYKLEVKSKNWFLRGYTTQENSGDSYTATTAALYINRSWRSDADWFGTYSATYAGNRNAGASNVQAHTAARNAAEAGRIQPGTTAFKTAFANAISTDISAGGARFADKSNLYHYEGQLNLTDQVKVVEVLVGASFRQYKLNSKGTIFVDTTGPISINEYGGYVQLQKTLLEDRLKLTGSVRYDKNENFEGQFTPRVSALVKVAKDHNIRLSYQTAYRFPSTQDQYINLLTGGANRLIGGLPQFETFFKFNTNPAYTSESIVAYRNSGNPALLKTAKFSTINPEKVSSYEIGYKALIQKKLLIDVYAYQSKYQDFIARTAVGRGKSGDPTKAATELASPFTTDNYSFVVTSPTPVKAVGFGVGIEYNIYQNYGVSANVFGDELKDVPAGLITFFNTPKIRYNLGVSNSNIFKGVGFNVNYRWQDKMNWEGTFGAGEVPAYGTLDAMVSYKLSKANSLLKVGATNLLNKYYRSAFGNPQIGGLYYVSFGYNVF
jgi:outer membrane receptor protein involved in Fe transport